MYPIKLEPIYKEIIWGGRNLEKMGRDLPKGRKIAESWELSVRDGDQSVIRNGCFRGRTLDEVLRTYGETFLGEKPFEKYGHDFPLFVKIIDANDKLSLQVHPGDGYARSREGQRFGKDETWIIISSDTDAKIVYGLKDTLGRESFIKAVGDGDIVRHLNQVEAVPGDVFNIYPGLVHGLGKGIVVAEIQQNSNTTYRIYDYGRKDKDGGERELHIEKALDVIDLDASVIKGANEKIREESGRGCRTATYVENALYTLQLIDVSDEYVHDTCNERFYIYMLISGNGEITYDGGREAITGLETIFVPACLGKYRFRGEMRLIRAFV